MSARKALYVRALNALVENGLDLSYDSIGEEERNHLSMSQAPQRVTCQFDIEGVPCVATCRPTGCGEEKVVVVYNSHDVEKAEDLCRVGCTIQHLRPGITAGTFQVERRRGPYIMSTPPRCDNFRCTRLDHARLRGVHFEPNGFAAEGRLIV